MARTHSKKRPWLAAFLAVFATGAGHVYLRRWLRALGWLGVAALTSYLFVPVSALEAFVFGGEVAWLDLLPLLVVTTLSALDAYQLAVVNNYFHRVRTHNGAGPTACPSCGRPMDDDLEFCQWCATPGRRGTDSEARRSRKR